MVRGGARGDEEEPSGGVMSRAKSLVFDNKPSVGAMKHIMTKPELVHDDEQSCRTSVINRVIDRPRELSMPMDV